MALPPPYLAQDGPTTTYCWNHHIRMFEHTGEVTVRPIYCMEAKKSDSDFCITMRGLPPPYVKLAPLFGDDKRFIQKRGGNKMGQKTGWSNETFSVL